MPFDSSGTFSRVRSWISDAAAGIKIRADYHDTHDTDLANGLSQCITKDGRTQPTADLPMNTRKLLNLGEPTAAGDAANKQYVDNAILAAQAAMAMPTGVMMPYAKYYTPAGWLYCNGQAVNRVTYAALYALIGTTYGAGDGATTFNVPDMRGEFARGFDDGRGLDPGRTFGSTQTDDLEAHTHTATASTESAAHTHTFSDSSSTTGGASAGHTHTVPGRIPTATPGAGFAFGSGVTYIDNPQSGGQSATHTHTVAVSGTTSAESAAHLHYITVNAVGGPETRPHNVAICWIIKT